MAAFDDRDARIAHAARLSLLVGANVFLAIEAVRLAVVGPDAAVSFVPTAVAVLIYLARRP